MLRPIGFVWGRPISAPRDPRLISYIRVCFPHFGGYFSIIIPVYRATRCPNRVPPFPMSPDSSSVIKHERGSRAGFIFCSVVDSHATRNTR